jgi:hypothetical protein
MLAFTDEPPRNSANEPMRCQTGSAAAVLSTALT